MPFIWMGNTRASYEALAPKQKITLPVQACMFTPGVYNLNMFRIVWKVEGESMGNVMSYQPFQHLVTVRTPTAN